MYTGRALVERRHLVAVRWKGLLRYWLCAPVARTPRDCVYERRDQDDEKGNRDWNSERALRDIVVCTPFGHEDSVPSAAPSGTA